MERLSMRVLYPELLLGKMARFILAKPGQVILETTPVRFCPLEGMTSEVPAWKSCEYKQDFNLPIKLNSSIAAVSD